MNCLWCREPIRRRSRRDTLYCSTAHRQAAWRFNGAARPSDPILTPSLRDGPAPGGRYAYADPPYPGLARRYYRDHPDFGGEVDHGALLSRLTTEFDGWALSTSAAALRDVLAVAPRGVRVAAWVRGPRGTASYSPQNAWEPVIYYGARRVLSSTASIRLDVVHYVLRPRLSDPARVIGSKPAAFCSWLFTLLGLLPADELVDIFPGSGRVAEAWQTYRRSQIHLAMTSAIETRRLL